MTSMPAIWRASSHGGSNLRSLVWVLRQSRGETGGRAPTAILAPLANTRAGVVSSASASNAASLRRLILVNQLDRQIARELWRLGANRP
jgi:hypothetical protein